MLQREIVLLRLGPGDPASVRASSRRTRCCRPQRVPHRTVGPRPAPSPDPGSDVALCWHLSEKFSPRRRGSARFTTTCMAGCLTPQASFLRDTLLSSRPSPARMGARDAARNESTRLRALRGTAACRGQGSLLRGGQLDRGTLAFPRGVSRGASASFSATWTKCMQAGKSA